MQILTTLAFIMKSVVIIYRHRALNAKEQQEGVKKDFFARGAPQKWSGKQKVWGHPSFYD